MIYRRIRDLREDKDMTQTAISQRIRDLREDRDLTQKNMGEILNCSQRIYSNYERGDVDIPTSILIQLADFHHVSVDYLLNRTDNPAMNK